MCSKKRPQDRGCASLFVYPCSRPALLNHEVLAPGPEIHICGALGLPVELAQPASIRTGGLR